MGVPGQKILESESNEQTQDFLMMNNNAFFIDKLSTYSSFIKAANEGWTGLLKFAVLHPKTVMGGLSKLPLIGANNAPENNNVEKLLERIQCPAS